MDNALMVGLSRQMTLRRALDVTANNLANMSTAGFKLETPVLAANAQRGASHVDGPRDIQFAQDWSLLRDFSQGELRQTGRSFDVALEGEGFFAVDAGGEGRFTRDGRFTVDAEGRLTTAAGYTVLDEGGGEISIPPDAASIVISSSGSISADGAEIGRLQVVRFANLSALAKDGDGNYRIEAEDVVPEPVEAPVVRQGFVENSNVQPITEITRMIETTRAYESMSRMIQTQEELKRRAVDRLGRVS